MAVQSSMPPSENMVKSGQGKLSAEAALSKGDSNSPLLQQMVGGSDQSV
jgi:hypothetical protein